MEEFFRCYLGCHEIVIPLLRRFASSDPELHLALSLGSAETARLLLKQGVDVNAQGESPLHLTSYW